MTVTNMYHKYTPIKKKTFLRLSVHKLKGLSKSQQEPCTTNEEIRKSKTTISLSLVKGKILKTSRKKKKNLLPTEKRMILDFYVILGEGGDAN